MMPRFPRLLGIGLAGLLLLPSCGRSNSVPQPPPPQTHTVTIEGMRFDPADLIVRTGDTIVWVNKDLFAHTATADAGAFDSKSIDPEGSWRFTPRTAGELAYICALHPTMKAMVRVKAATEASRSNVQ
jgi:plastocyanin